MTPTQIKILGALLVAGGLIVDVVFTIKGMPIPSIVASVLTTGVALLNPSVLPGK
jgi:hypothetical protein